MRQAHQQPATAPTLPISTRTWVQDHPPFLRGSERFSKADSFSTDAKPGQVPGSGANLPYHVAYGEVNREPLRSSKGWAALDDPIKSGRGTSTGKFHSSMAPAQAGVPECGSSLLPLAATYPNEARLQELLSLQKRKAEAVPGPGAYECTRLSTRKSTFRRAPEPGLDGPFYLQDNELSTRSKELASVICNAGDSGLGPGEYDPEPETGTRGPMAKIGTSSREGKTPHVKSLSISRSISHGIDWHVPVVVHVRVPESATSPKAAPSTANRALSAPAAQQRNSSEGGQPGGGGNPGEMDGGTNRFGATGGRTGNTASFSGRPFASSGGEAMPAPHAPPAALLRFVRRDQARLPGEWDWERLGQSNRHMWATQHGGAYTHGERGNVLLEAQNADRLQQQQQQQQPGRMLSSPQQMETFDADEAGNIFSIAEEASASGEPLQAMAMGPPRSEASVTPVTPATGRRSHTNSPAMSSRLEMERHAAAASAAALVQATNMRRASWSVRSGASSAAGP